MYILNIEALGCVILDSRTRKLHRFIGGIVEHLNLKLIAWVINRGDRLEESLNHVHLVKKRKLNGDVRQIAFGIFASGTWTEFVVAPKVYDLFNAVPSVDRENAKYREVKPQNRIVEGIQLIKRADIAPGLINTFAKTGEFF